MQRAITALALAAALVVTGCSDDDGPDPGDPTGGPTKISARAVILTPADIWEGAVDPEPDWTPTRDAVETADAALDGYGSGDPDLGAIRLNDFYRQYVGVAGEAIQVNAFCRYAGAWLSSYIAVLDGGACYWQATVLADGTVKGFRTGGHA